MALVDKLFNKDPMDRFSCYFWVVIKKILKRYL